MRIEDQSYEHILFSREGDDGEILIASFNRPDKLNAVNRAMHDDLEHLFQDIQQDRSVRVAVITGEGRGFCAGADVAGFRSPTGSGIERDWDAVRFDDRLMDGLMRCDRPIISMVNGPAAGLGATIALFADICVMAEDARLGDTHVTYGLVAGDGGANIMPLLVGPMKAKELLMLGEFVTGRQAADMGLVNYAVPAEQLRETTMGLARRLADQPVFAVRATKVAVNRYVKMVAEHVGDAAAAWERISMTHPSRQDAPGFRQKVSRHAEQRRD